MDEKYDKEEKVLQLRAEKRAARASSADIMALRVRRAEALRHQLEDSPVQSDAILSSRVGLRSPASGLGGVAGIIAWDHDGAGDSLSIYDRDQTDSIVWFDIGPDNNDHVATWP